MLPDQWRRAAQFAPRSLARSRLPIDPAHPVESGLHAPPPPALASGGKNQPATIQPIAPAQRLMASGPADRAQLAETLADALALLEGVVAAAPATVAPHAA